jgi:hypothetical protein
MVLVTGWIVILVATANAPAGMVNNSLPSADKSVPPPAPKLFDIGVPVGVPTGVMAAVESRGVPVVVPVLPVFAEPLFLHDDNASETITVRQITGSRKVMERGRRPINLKFPNGTANSKCGQ